MKITIDLDRFNIRSRFEKEIGREPEEKEIEDINKYIEYNIDDSILDLMYDAMSDAELDGGGEEDGE